MKDLLELFPEVMWDRMPNEYSVFGWIDRPDQYKDFVLIKFTSTYDLDQLFTSSAEYSALFAKRLHSTHTPCTRVEDVVNIENMVRKC